MVRRMEREETHSMRTELTVERLRQLVHYSPRTGRFYWRERRGNAAAGFEAGSGDKDGYRRIQIDGQRRSAHRLAWLYVHGEHPAGHIDHKNKKPADNRIKNLRDAPPQKNMWHRTSRSKSGIKGVSLRGSKWRARITVNGEEIDLGSFGTRAEAKAAYQAGALLLHGKFAETRGRRARTKPGLARRHNPARTRRRRSEYGSSGCNRRATRTRSPLPLAGNSRKRK